MLASHRESGTGLISGVEPVRCRGRADAQGACDERDDAADVSRQMWCPEFPNDPRLEPGTGLGADCTRESIMVSWQPLTPGAQADPVAP